MSYTFLLGGARSGKSSLAVRLAASAGAPVVVIATAEGRDEEMAGRIAAHRAARPPDWETVEAPVRLLEAATDVPDDACVILDCLTLWVSNALEKGMTEDEIADESSAVAKALAGRSGRGVVVSNEVGLG